MAADAPRLEGLARRALWRARPRPGGVGPSGIRSGLSSPGGTARVFRRVGHAGRWVLSRSEQRPAASRPMSDPEQDARDRRGVLRCVVGGTHRGRRPRGPARAVHRSGWRGDRRPLPPDGVPRRPAVPGHGGQRPRSPSNRTIAGGTRRRRTNPRGTAPALPCLGSHVHAPNPAPSSRQICAPLSPLGQTQADDAPGTHAVPTWPVSLVLVSSSCSSIATPLGHPPVATGSANNAMQPKPTHGPTRIHHRFARAVTARSPQDRTHERDPTPRSAARTRRAPARTGEADVPSRMAHPRAAPTPRRIVPSR